MTVNVSSRINGIRNALNSDTGMGFHKRVSTCLFIMFRDSGIKLDRPKQQGGEGGVDAFVENQDLYFAFSSELNHNRKTVNKKIESDARKLIDTVIVNGQYTGKVSKFIFVYCTFGQEKTNDRHNSIKEIFDSLFREFDIYFEYEIWNAEDVINELRDRCTPQTLDKIVMDLNIYDFVSHPDYIKEVRELLNRIEDFGQVKPEFTYVRRSTEKKIVDSDLILIKDEIDELLSTPEYYSKLESVISDDFFSPKFMILRQKIIDIYSEPTELEGVDLFISIVDRSSEILMCSKILAKTLVLYIFDSCDIF